MKQAFDERQLRNLAAFCVATGLASLTYACPARAAAMLDVIGAPLSNSPFSARVHGSGPEAAYFNPALLLDAEPGVHTGLFYLGSSLSIHLQGRPNGVDVPGSIYDAREATADGSSRRLEQRPLATSALRARRGSADPNIQRLYASIGVVAHAFDHALAFGVYAIAPTNRFQTQHAFYPDEREQYFSNSLNFELFGDRLETSIIAFAGAIRLASWARMGMGATLSTTTSLNNSVYMPDTSKQEQAFIADNVVVKNSIVPHLGVVVEPIRRLHISSTLHFPYHTDMKGENELQLWNYEYPTQDKVLRQPVVFHSYDTPIRLGAGIRYMIVPNENTTWSLAAGAVFTRWSAYRNRLDEQPLDKWFDTLQPSMGTVVTSGAHSFGLDVVYVPSPVPDQLGRTNYVDNDRLGTALAWQMKVSVGGVTLRGGIHLQAQRLLQRSVVKTDQATHAVSDEFPDSVNVKTGLPIADSSGFQTNNPGYPGFSSQGWLFGGGLSLALLL